MNILVLPSWYPNKNNPVSGNFVRELAKASSYYDEIVVIHAFGDDIKFVSISDGKEDGLRVIRVRYNKHFSLFFYLICMFFAFKRLKKEWYPDIIHAHVYFPAGLAAVILGKIFGIPVIIMEHAEIIDVYKKETTLKKIKDFFRVKIAEYTLYNTQLILSVSRSLKEHLYSFGIRNEIKIVPNTINTKIFLPLKNKHNDKSKKRIIFIGGLIPRKGIPCLLEAINIVKNKRKDFVLDIIGDGPFKNEYFRISEENGLSDIVRFRGKVNDLEKLKLLQNSDFMILPSLYESFGVVLLEAMACGKPVISTLSGGQKEFVNKNVGILVPAKDSMALARAIEYMLDNCHKYPSKKISKYVREKFSYTAVGKLLHDTYTELLIKNGAVGE